MRVAILGCGSMGTVLGAFLTKNGCNVEFIDAWKEHVDALNANGARIDGTVDFTVPVKAVTLEQMEGIYDLVFLFTKQTTNYEVLPKLLPHLGENSTVCTLQNGVPEPYVASLVGEKRTVGGTVLWGATLKGPGVSTLTQNLDNLDHYFDIGEIDGSITERIRQVKAVLDLMGPASITQELMASRWGKIVNNACMSGMSAACGTTFGGALENEKARACLSYLGREVKACCEAEGYKMPTLVFGYSPETLDLKDQAMYDANQQMFWNMYQVALPGKASMLQDLEKGRKCEISMINGYVSETGKKHGIPTPFNDTVVAIVSKIENGSLTLSMDNLKYFDDAWLTFEKYQPK